MKKNAIIYIDDTHAQVTKAFEKQGFTAYIITHIIQYV